MLAKLWFLPQYLEIMIPCRWRDAEAFILVGRASCRICQSPFVLVEFSFLDFQPWLATSRVRCEQGAVVTSSCERRSWVIESLNTEVLKWKESTSQRV